MSKRTKLNLLYIFLIIIGWLMCGIGFGVRIEPMEIGEAMFLFGPILIFTAIVLLILNNAGKKKIRRRR
jgi:hypothetical protein